MRVMSRYLVNYTVVWQTGDAGQGVRQVAGVGRCPGLTFSFSVGWG